MDISNVVKTVFDKRTSGSALLIAVNLFLKEMGVNPLPDWASWVIAGGAAVYLTFFVKAEKK